MEFASIYLFLAVIIVLILGYPVALSLAGTALIAAAVGIISGSFDAAFLNAIPSRVFGIISNQTLIAVPLFVFMGNVVSATGMGEDAYDVANQAFRKIRGGLAIGTVGANAVFANVKN